MESALPRRGNSVRSTARLCDVEKRTVLNLLKTAGDRCERLLDASLQNLPVRDLHRDEFWSYVFKKEGHKLPDEIRNDEIADQYIFVGLERTSKLVVAWHLGRRDRENTALFISKIRKATTDERSSMFPRMLAYLPVDAQFGDCATIAPVNSMNAGRRTGTVSPGSFAT